MHDGGKGFLFGGGNHTFQPGTVYTLDADPNNINAFWQSKVTDGLLAGGENTLYNVLSGQPHPEPAWSEANVAGQRRFLDGLDALHTIGFLHDFEQSKREFIGEYGATHLMLVQGPPGTGKSYSTAFAIFARIQGAMATNTPYRVFLSCKTHAATDVLLENVVDVQHLLEKIRSTSRISFGSISTMGSSTSRSSACALAETSPMASPPCLKTRSALRHPQGNRDDRGGSVGRRRRDPGRHLRR